jgi:hypothetical protein
VSQSQFVDTYEYTHTLGSFLQWRENFDISIRNRLKESMKDVTFRFHRSLKQVSASVIKFIWVWETERMIFLKKCWDYLLLPFCITWSQAWNGREMHQIQIKLTSWNSTYKPWRHKRAKSLDKFDNVSSMLWGKWVMKIYTVS